MTRIQQKTVSVAAKTREDTASVTKKQYFADFSWISFLAGRLATTITQGANCEKSMIYRGPRSPVNLLMLRMGWGTKIISTVANK